MKLNLNKKYVIGCHVMFYEIEIFSNYIDGILNIVENIENEENIYIDICFNVQEYFEKIDINKISIDEIYKKFYKQLDRLNFNKNVHIKTNNDKVYNIADYRRDINSKYCTEFDFILWGETDSFFPKETFEILENISEYTKNNNINRYILSFSDRKMWDITWKVTEHIDYENIEFIDDNNAYKNKLYAKSELSIEEMNTINSKYRELDIRILNEPKIDGSCLVISSDLIKSGVNIPHALLCSGEDASFGEIAKKICGNSFIQIIIKNILKVHARRHNKKRMYVFNEDNPFGFCDEKNKGKWWKILQNMSKYNLNIIFNNQQKFYTFDDVFKKIGENK